MIVQSACQAPSRREAPSKRDHATENLSRPKCPRCDSILLVAEESRFNAGGRIDHAWSCDDCGNAFMTTIRLLPR